MSTTAIVFLVVIFSPALALWLGAWFDLIGSWSGWERWEEHRDRRRRGS